MRHLQESCLLMQIETDLCSLKDPKSFKFWTKNAIFGNLKHALRLDFQKQLSYFKSAPLNLSKNKAS